MFAVGVVLQTLTLTVHSYILNELEGAVTHESLFKHRIELLLDLVVQVRVFAGVVLVCGLSSVQEFGRAVNCLRMWSR